MKIKIIKQAVLMLGLYFIGLSINLLAAQDSSYPNDRVLISPSDDWISGQYAATAVEHLQARHSIRSAVEADLQAGQSIQLQSGFQAATGAKFRAYIADVHKKTATNLASIKWATISSNKAKNIGLNNYPNPFQQQTTIEYTLPESAKVSLRIYNLTGKLQATLLTDEVMEAGFHQVVFDAKDLASGIYLCQLTIANQQINKKMIIN